MEMKQAIFKQAEQLPACVASADSGAWNGMFGTGRQAWKAAQARGRTQVQFEVFDALPAYQQKVAGALARPKQHAMF